MYIIRKLQVKVHPPSNIRASKCRKNYNASKTVLEETIIKYSTVIF